MNNYWKIGLAFASGLVIGAIATKKFLEYKNDKEYEYEEEISEEDAINEEGPIEEFDVAEDLELAFNSNREEIMEASTPNSRIDYTKIKSVNDVEYNRLLDDLKYSIDNEAEVIEADMIPVEPALDRTKPYYINQDDFEGLEEFESDEYTYYTDGYLTDSYGMPVSDDDINNTVGIGFEAYFDQYNEDQICIRNEQLQMDFSIIRDVDKFVDVAPPRIKRMVGLQ